MAAIRKRTWTYNDKKRTAYEFTLYADGKRVRRQFSTRAEAQAALDAFRDDLKNPKPTVSTLEFGIAVDRVLDLKARKSPATRRDYARIGRDLKAEFGAETPIVEITASRVAEYEGKRLAATRTIGKGEHAIARPLSLAALNRPRAFLRHVLRQAQECGALTTVPKIRTARETGRLHWLRPEEAVRLLDACRKSQNKALADLVEFALFTGVRQSEALGLTWDRVDRATGSALLVDTKNGDPRTVHLNQNADAVLARRWSPDAKGLVFGGRNWNGFRSAWETALRTARIENFRFHDLRHTFASWAVQRGATLQEVKDLLGHKTLAMTLRYAHLAPERLRAAVATLDGILQPQDATPVADGRKVGARESASRNTSTAAVSEVLTSIR
jgi:integrase